MKTAFQFHKTLCTITLLTVLVMTATAQQNQTAYRYDTIGRLVEVTYPDSSSIRYAYDKNGNILSIISTTKNTAPTATSATISTDEDTPSVPVTPDVTDPNQGDTHTFAIVTQPARGSASVVSNQLRYTPAQDYNGSDNFTFRATDAGGLSVVGTANITVRPVNDAPATFNRTSPTDASVQQRAPVTLSWSQSNDVDGDAITYTLRVRVATIDSSMSTQNLSTNFNFGQPGLSPQRHTVTWSVSSSDSKVTTQASNNDGNFIIDSVTVGTPLIQISQKNLLFGTVKVGQSKALPTTISNAGTNTLSITGITSSNPVFTSTLNAFSLVPSASTVDTIRFTPIVIGAISGLITVANNSPKPSDTILVSGVGEAQTPVDGVGTPLIFSLAQNYPNPVSTSTTFEFTIPKSSHVTLEIYNVLGMKVKTLINDEVNSGSHQLRWDKIDLPDGMYVYRIVGVEFVQAKKLVLYRP